MVKSKNIDPRVIFLARSCGTYCEITGNLLQDRKRMWRTIAKSKYMDSRVKKQCMAKRSKNIDPLDKTILPYITGDLHFKIMWYLCRDCQDRKGSGETKAKSIHGNILWDLQRDQKL